ncbi:MAG: ADP-ribosylglycohydrolase family protein [Acidobacteria bacterium]|jgi:ADP-ribosylglycohydrolase|nr:MAG: ADP-ribosylglycohydrolase family protein [Acidobacteriota bacterium]
MELLDKFIGVVLGGALGDAIGKCLEDVPKGQALEFYGGEVMGYVEPHPMSPAVGLEPNQITDETTISLLLLESIVEKGHIDPFHFFQKLRDWSKKEEVHRYPDPTLLTAIDLLSAGVGLEEAGIVSYSVEGILRCAITGLFHYYNPYLASEAGRLVSLITHRSKEIYDASAVLSAAISYLLLDSFDLRHEVDRYALLEQLANLMKHEKNRLYLRRVEELLKAGSSLEEAIKQLGNSTYVFEALPLSLFIFLSNVEDPIEAFWQGVNACGDFGGDTDAIGYLVGSLVGAYAGAWVFPSELLENLENSGYYITLTERLYDKTLAFLERRS